jgi:hypothetical protein
MSVKSFIRLPRQRNLLDQSYGEYMKMCKYFTPNYDDKKLAVAP